MFPDKAYENPAFLSSEAARPIRVLCEYEEPRQRFLEQEVKNTIVFFGSARLHNGPYYEGARELSRQLTAWSMQKPHGSYHYYICSGGGPGIMEAANRGAADAGGKSIGLGISLPQEETLNSWVTPELGFEFHYFSMRKYWFLVLCKALVIFPGGFGTLDELFETLTLVQTGKIKGRLPIILFGTDYWHQVLNLKAMVELGTISPEDVALIYPTNSIEDAFRYITQFLLNAEDPNSIEALPKL